jgi:hypothetical protein
MAIDPELLSAVQWYVVKVAAVSVPAVGALFVWLGRVSAKRIETRENAKHSRDLENVKAELTRSVQLEVKRLETELSILRDKTLGAHNLKIQIYQEVIEPLSSFMLRIENGTLTNQGLGEFNLQRAKSYARLAMFAPQAVLDAYDVLVDYLNDHLEGRHPFDWPTIRQLIHQFLNAARADIGMGAGAIVYHGHR